MIGLCFAFWVEMQSPDLTLQDSTVPSIEQSHVPNRVSGFETVAGDEYRKEYVNSRVPRCTVAPSWTSRDVIFIGYGSVGGKNISVGLDIWLSESRVQS